MDIAVSQSTMQQAIARGPFESSWEALKAYTVPNWYVDGKYRTISRIDTPCKNEDIIASAGETGEVMALDYLRVYCSLFLRF